MSRIECVVKVCPQCKRTRTFIPHCYSKGAAVDWECRECGWRGDSDGVETHKFWQEEVSHIKIDWGVIDRIVYLYYGHSDSEFGTFHYEFVVNGECSNDSSHQFSVDGLLDSYCEADAAEFRKDGKPRGLSNGDVLNILCQDGWLGPGEYLVEVCW